MWKPLKQTFILSVSCLLFGASLSAKECSEMYLEARTECERTAALCSEVKQCKDFRKSCNSDLKTMEGCEQMELCANDESPTLHNERCRYKWWGSASSGACHSRNYSTAAVSYLCPGFVGRKDTKYNDNNFSCSGQVAYYHDILNSCKEGIKKYYSQCSGKDAPRAIITPTPCETADEGPVVITDSPHIQVTPVIDIERTTSILQESSGVDTPTRSFWSRFTTKSGESR